MKIQQKYSQNFVTPKRDSVSFDANFELNILKGKFNIAQNRMDKYIKKTAELGTEADWVKVFVNHLQDPLKNGYDTLEAAVVSFVNGRLKTFNLRQEYSNTSWAGLPSAKLKPENILDGMIMGQIHEIKHDI